MTAIDVLHYLCNRFPADFAEENKSMTQTNVFRSLPLRLAPL